MFASFLSSFSAPSSSLDDDDVSFETREFYFDEILFQLIGDSDFENEDSRVITGVRNVSLARRVMQVGRNVRLGRNVRMGRNVRLGRRRRLLVIPLLLRRVRLMQRVSGAVIDRWT